MAVCGLALLLVFTLCGCGAQRQTGEWYAMDTVMTAAVYGSADALDAVEAETYRLDALLAAQKDDSEIAAVNDGAEVVSEETAALLRRALEIAAETNGAYDPTVYPLMRVWGFTDGNYRVPADAELDALLQTTGWTEVSVDGTTASLPEGFALDLGGIGKGYAAGRCKEILKAHGVTSALLSLGGNVSALGASRTARPGRSRLRTRTAVPISGQCRSRINAWSLRRLSAVFRAGWRPLLAYFRPRDGKTRSKRHEISDDRVGG